MRVAIDGRYAGSETVVEGRTSVAARMAASASRCRASLPFPRLVRPRTRKTKKPASGTIRMRISHAMADEGFLLLGSTPRARNLIT